MEKLTHTLYGGPRLILELLRIWVLKRLCLIELALCMWECFQGEYLNQLFIFNGRNNGSFSDQFLCMCEFKFVARGDLVHDV